MSEKKTDFNDLSKEQGNNVVQFEIVKALQEKAAAKEAALNLETEREAFQIWEQQIAASDDVFDLVHVIYPQLASAPLISEQTREILAKQIARKAKIPLSSLIGKKSDRKKARPPASPPAEDMTAEDKLVDELNRIHSVVPIGGGVYIVNRDYDPMLDRHVLSFSCEQHFNLRYRNRQIHCAGELIGLGEYWLKHSQRRQYDGLIFSPERDVEGYLNMWQSWGCEPKEGTCDLWIKFVEEIICQNDRELFDYILMYFAHMVQRPREMPETSIVLRGEQGVGKNTFFEVIGAIVGKAHYIMLSSMQQIVGRFSGHLCDVLFVACNEGVWGGNREAHGMLKSMITDAYQPMERKGKDIVMVQNFKRVLFSTNENWAVPRDMDDRRHIICDVSPKRKNDYPYWAAIRQEMQNGGVEALFHMLKTLDLGDWHPREIPERMKIAGWGMKIKGAGSIDKWWFEMLLQGYIIRDERPYAPDESVNDYWPERIQPYQLQASYLRWCEDYKVNHREHSAEVAERLFYFGVSKAQRRRSDMRKRYYLLPALIEAREIYQSKFKLPATIWGDEWEDDDIET
jgi:hypothetical protein